jgi:hypothetical protein
MFVFDYMKNQLKEKKNFISMNFLKKIFYKYHKYAYSHFQGFQKRFPLSLKYQISVSFLLTHAHTLIHIYKADYNVAYVP